MPAIAVFGAGHVGCYVGGRLAAAGAAVTLVGRPPVLDTLAARGLTLSDYRGWQAQLAPAQLHLAASPEAAAGADVVLVTVKSAATAAAAQALRDVLKPGAVVLSLQNGLHNAEVLAAGLPAQTVLAGMVAFNVVQHGPGHYHQASEGGLMAAAADGIRPVLPLFAHAGLALELRHDMPAVQWAKLLLNLNNAVNALSGLPLRAELAQRDFRRVLALAQRETLALLARRKLAPARLTPVPPQWMPRLLDVPDAAFRLLANRMLAIDPLARSSMWDDLEAGRPTEVAYINGEVVALARSLQTDAPVNTRLMQLVHAAEAGGRRDWSGAALLAAVRTGA